MTQASVMELLKYSTQKEHSEIERALNLMDPSFSIASYGRLLASFYGYYLPWEQRCGPALHSLTSGFFEQRLKTPLLKQDLAYLGYRDFDTVPLCPHMPLLQTVADALGSMYVIEGSTLGGRLLSRHFAESLSIHAESGGRFFAGYGERTGVMWREFAAVVETHGITGASQEMVVAARNTFRTLNDWLVER